MQKKNIIASANFWTTCCVLLATRFSESAHFTTFINIVYFPFRENLTYTVMQYYKPIECKNAVNAYDRSLLIKM
jgi:hypothetical protein